jgi:serine/threonine protein kinase
MRDQPRERLSRQWTVLPATMGLTELGSARRAVSAKPQAAGGARGPVTDVVPWRLGNYELEQRLGSGGMGDVYRARHSQFGRLRAVKVIKQHLVDTGQHEVIRRFYQEIKAVGALEHPNIVVAIDSSLPTDSVHYLVMEYIEGIGADELVERDGPLGVAEACEIARQAARGLAYIHQHGMVHRDIKPSNLMLTLAPREEDGWHAQGPGDGRGLGADVPRPSRTQGVPLGREQSVVVKILDLGLALLVGDDQQRLTMFDNRPMGTAMYMSPEQWKTTSVDIRADIYSLGCSLYHLLAGKPPFLESDLRPEKAHERENLPPLRITGLSEASYKALWALLERMTAKRPEERIGDPAEVAAALAPFAEGHRLAEVVERAMSPASRAQTQGVAKVDTLIAKSAESDTRTGQKPVSWSSLKSLPLASRQKLQRAFIGFLLLVAVGSIGWLAISTWRAHALEGRTVGLKLAANFAASAILSEINERFVLLKDLASERELREWMIELQAASSDEEKKRLQKEIESWLGTHRSNSARRVQGESWFINDRTGVQVARSPQSSKSTGRVYAHRDYFHGQGKHLPEGTQGLAPIEAPHLSAVYRSTSDETLRVAFSVPIENGRSGAERQVIGVLAMSVDLNDFDVLERSIPAKYQVVLIDLREETIEDEEGGEKRGRGLVLHMQERGDSSDRRAPQWIGAELLGELEHAVNSAKGRLDDAAVLSAYRDEALTSGKKYWGAVKLLIDPRPERDVRDTGWLVLVQEPYSNE